jgi:flagellar basal body-associated protein FliL
MEENKKVWMTGLGVIIIIVAALAIYYFFFQTKTEEVPEATAIEETKPVEPIKEEKPLKDEPVEPIDVSLDDSDSVIRDLIRGLSTHPKLADWVVTTDLVRKFVAAVDNIASGQSPRAHVDFFKTKGNFKVVEKSGRIYIDPSSYSRYKPVAEAFGSFDTAGSVRLFRQLRPVIQEAYRDLGYPDQVFQDTLVRAIQELLRVPVVKDVLVQKKVISYEMIDPRLEKLSQAQKHLLRMGPENVQKIQSKLRELASALGVAPSKIPSD